MGQRRKTRAEIVEGNAETHVAHGVQVLFGLLAFMKQDGLGDLEFDCADGYLGVGECVLELLREVALGDLSRGYVDPDLRR